MITKRYIGALCVTFCVTFVVSVLTLMPSQNAHAATYTQTTADIAQQLQAITAQLRQLQAQLAAIQNQNPSNNYYYSPQPQAGQQCYSDAYGKVSCYPTQNYNYGNTYGNLSRIDVNQHGNYADAEIRYANGRIENVSISARSQNDIIDLLASHTGASYGAVSSVTHFNASSDNYRSGNEDIDRITVTISSGDARVRVEYDDGGVDRFTIDNETNHNDIIREIADDLDISTSDVRDVIRWTDNSNGNGDVDTIMATIDRDNNETDVDVEYDDGSDDSFSYDTDVKSEIVSDLADDLDISESEVRDIIEYDYN